jgi:hypothetical protein
MALFVCRECGSAGLTMPRELSDEALVHCCGCQAQRGTWRGIRDIAAELIALECRDGLSSRLSWASADPMPAFQTLD